MPPSPALKDEKEAPRVTFGGPLEAQVVAQEASEERGQRQRAISLPLAAYAQATVGPDEIANVELEDLSGPQTAQEHQVDDREIAIAPERAQEGANLLGRQRLDERPRLANSHSASARRHSVETERVVAAGSLVVHRGAVNAWALIELVTGEETKEETKRRQTTVDRPGCGMASLLLSDEVDEVGGKQVLDPS
jgi:hypothetical protein